MGLFGNRQADEMTQTLPAERHCSNCGGKVKADAIFSSGCGTEL